MVKINVMEGLRPRLPPATPGEIFEVCIWAFLATSIIGGTVLGIVFLLGRLIHGPNGCPPRTVDI